MLANPGLSKAEPRWGSSILQTSFAPLLLLKEMKLKKRNTDGVVPPRYVLTQGSLHYRLATLGYQKRNPDGVRRPHEKRSLWAVCPFERNEIKKAQHLRRCVPCYVLTQGSSLRSPTLGYQKQNPDGVRLSHELPLRPLFLLK